MTPLNSEIELLRSQALIANVLRDDAVGLSAHVETPPEAVRPLSRLTAALRHAMGRARGSNFDRLVSDLERRLDIRPIRTSNVIEISLRSADPEWAVQFVTGLVAHYLERRLDVFQNPRAVAFFEEQVDTSRHRLRNAEDALERFVQVERMSLPLDARKQSVLVASQELFHAVLTLARRA